MTATAAAIAYYVATDGSDANDGSIDHPFATLERARVAMNVTGSPRTTYLRGGTYRLSATLSLGATDSGQTWASYPGESATISGGEHIAGAAFSADGNGVYSAATAPTDLDLSIAGERQTAARNVAYNPTDATTGWLVGAPVGNGHTFQFNPGDATAQQLTVGAKIEAYPDLRWANTIATVTAVDWANHRVTLSSDINFWDFNPGSKIDWRLIGGASSVDQAGEFGWDAARGRVVVKPTDAAALLSGGADIARLGDLIDVSGANITLSGLNFTNSTHDGAAVRLRSATGASIVGNNFANVGQAVRIDGAGADNNSVAGNTIVSTADDAISVYFGRGNVIRSNSILHANGIHVGGAAIGLYAAQTTDVNGNFITDDTRYGISLTKYDNILPVGNVIENNIVSHTSTQTSDTGAIEFWANHDNSDSHTIIRDNQVSDVGGLIADSATGALRKGIDAHDIYLDDGASGVSITGNFLGATPASDIFIHGGRDIAISGNQVLLDPVLAVFHDGGQIAPATQAMVYDRTMEFAFAASAFQTTVSHVVVRARADLAQNVGAHFNLLLDGVKVGEATAGVGLADYAFSFSARAGTAHRIGVKFDNDLRTASEDRNLYVVSATLNGVEIPVSGVGVAVGFQPVTDPGGVNLLASGGISVTDNVVSVTGSTSAPKPYIEASAGWNPFSAIDGNSLFGVGQATGFGAGYDAHSSLSTHPLVWTTAGGLTFVQKNDESGHLLERFGFGYRALPYVETDLVLDAVGRKSEYRQLTREGAAYLDERVSYAADGAAANLFSGVAFAGLTRLLIHDVAGHLIRSVVTGFTGRPYASIDQTFDTLGRMAEYRQLAADGSSYIDDKSVYDPGGGVTDTYSGAAYGALTIVKAKDASGRLLRQDLSGYADGSKTSIAYADDQTLTSTGAAIDRLNGVGAREHFIIHAGFARETISGVGPVAGGPPIVFDPALFADYGAFVAACIDNRYGGVNAIALDGALFTVEHATKAQLSAF